ncbi:hypothetical protein OVA24_00175 [Luteolibacter sp. SL250]|uniref:hypothetical protein n=1 Tax=Luteolibacter sp. SL250 TaxID=2995170 RepID=UPI00226E0193|nr:hypothetical protein [Luteolibacter sp. SL250]WAC19793.1 hypothetical protein OVA24_00175 [Luteolibacter sp. SL250]
MTHSGKTHLLSSFVALALIPAALTSPLQAAVVYGESFTNADSTDDPISTAGWVAYRGTTATAMTGSGTGTIYIPGGAGNGNPQVPGFLALNALSNGAYATFEGGLNINPANGALNISWQHHANVTGNAETRLLLRVGSQWVATTQVFTPVATGMLTDFNNVNNAGAFTRSFAYTTLASSWFDVNIAPGDELSISPSARVTDLGNSPITAIGFYYVASGTVSTRIDNLVVDQVPEPHLTTLLLAGAAGLSARRRRPARG